MNNIDRVSLDLQYQQCEKIIREKSKTFYMAFKALPEEQRNAVYALYAFNQRLDDLVADKQNIKKVYEEAQKFKRFREKEEVDDPIYILLNDIRNKFGIDIKAMESMFKGQLFDLRFHRIQTMEELGNYCYNVGGSIGHMLLPIVAKENYQKVYESAKYIGLGVQITSILKDIKEDYENDRIYIPVEIMAKYNVNIEHIIKHGVDEDYINMWEFMAQKAEAYYDIGLGSLSLYDKESKKVVRAAILMYREILNTVRANKYDFHKRPIIPKRKKMAILIKNKYL